MSRHLCRRRATSSATDNYATTRGSVPFSRIFTSARAVGIGLGLSRTALGAAFFAAPVTALRLNGVDTATAGRVVWLTQMTAVRDGVLGAGTVLACAGRNPRGAALWLAAGAVADAGDAGALAAALKTRRVAGPGAMAALALAGGAALVGAVAAVATARSHSPR